MRSAAEDETLSVPPAKRRSFIAPRSVAKDRPDLMVNVVSVNEVDAFPGTEPVSWVLVTTKPMDSQAQIERIVDAYRARCNLRRVPNRVSL